MPSFFAQMGIWAYPMLLSALLLLVQIGRVAVRAGSPTAGESTCGTQAILALGALNGVLGILGTAVGFYLAAGAIENAPSISPPIVWGGVKVALSTTIFGLLLLALSLAAWLVIRSVEGRKARAAA
jgi:hypothetical protein